MNLDAAVQAFATESSELLEDTESTLLELESDPNDSERINELFRAFHTIKGSAGMFGFDQVVTFTHGVESLLGKVRDGDQALNETMISLFLSCRDHIAILVDIALGENTALTPEQAQQGQTLSAQVDTLLNGEHCQKSNAIETTAPEQLDDNEAINTGPVASNPYWQISLRFKEDAMRNGMDPIAFIRYLKDLGEIIELKTLDHRLPEINSMDAETCYLGFEICFASDSNKQTIEEVFEFAQDDCAIKVLSPKAGIQEWQSLIDSVSEPESELIELFQSMKCLSEQDVQQMKLLSAAPVAMPQKQAAEIITAQPKAKQQKTSKGTIVRVDAAKLETLINQVGELVINGAGVQQHADRIADHALLESMEVMSRLVEEIRDTSLGLRMVQIGDTFNRFRRLVREISKEMGKDIELSISGADAELDKSVVEKIADPLTHLVRNAIDHGVETKEARIAAGKPAKGTVSLNAYHDSGSIVIEIVDDGGGLSKEKILAKAVEKELVEHGKQLTDQEIYMLIFEPGFSTAEKITNLSGRGVGMDVVRRNIDSLRGQVEVESTLGEGSTFRIRLPLTLAIIDGFQVSVGSATYVIPLDMVVECIELSPEINKSMGTSDYIDFRGSVLPALRIGEYFGEKNHAGKHTDIVVVQHAGLTAGLVVDQLLGEHQTVIKPLGSIFQNLRGISGATILGSGEVALIVDVPALLQRVVNDRNPKVSTTQEHITTH